MKKPKNIDPAVDLVLNEDELLLEQELENGEFLEEPGFAQTKAMLKEAATRHLALQKTKPITIRVNQLDLIRVKAKAKNKQIPYQTLLGSLIHQYAEGEKSLQL